MFRASKPVVGETVGDWLGAPRLRKSMKSLFFFPSPLSLLSHALAFSLSYVYYVKHEFAKKSFKYTIPKMINETQTLINDKVHTHSLNVFKLYTKTYFLSCYSLECSSPQAGFFFGWGGGGVPKPSAV